MTTTVPAAPPDATAPIAVITAANKRYGGVQALRDVSLSIAPGEVRALLGKNGAGKSTVIRLLSGVEEPDSGSVELRGEPLGRGGVKAAQHLGVRTVYQELSLIPDMTVAENLFMGAWPRRAGQIDRRLMARTTTEALGRLELDLDPRLPVSALSIADQQMVEIARALSQDPALLILDEPTSSLAAAEVDRVLTSVQRIRDAGVAVVYVSHRVSEIRQVAESATIMRDGQVVDTLPLAGVATTDIVRMMVGDVELETPLVGRTSPRGPVVMRVEGVTVAPKLVDVSFDVHAGEVLGIAGVLGSGRTELLAVMAGVARADSGSVVVDGRRVDGRGLRHAMSLGVGVTPENRKDDGIVPDLGIDENLVLTDWEKVTRRGVISTRRLAGAAAHAIASMSVRTDSARTPIGTLSGGNQQKVLIGRWLHAGSRVLLLDEPTRGVDVQAKAQIYDLLRTLAAQGVAVVFVSSEMDELPLVCDRALVLNGGSIRAEQVTPHIRTDQLLLAAIVEHSAPGHEEHR